MSNPTMEHLTIDNTTYDIVDSTSGYINLPSSNYGYFLKDNGQWRMPNALHNNYPPSYTLVMQTDGNLVMYDTTDDSAVWNTGEAGYRLKPRLAKTVSGTTNANGNISLGLAPATYTVLSVVRTDDNNTVCEPFQGGSNWYARCVQANTTTFALRASTSVTLRVIYCNTATLVSNLNS